MGMHSEKGPSSSERWINCTPSLKLCAGMPEQPSGFAQEGTDAHALCEYLLKTSFGMEAEDPTKTLTYYNTEMQECAENYVLYIQELLAEARKYCKDPVVMVEQLINYESYVEGGFGTADCIIVADKKLNVIDYKYGKGVEVSAKGNTQMKLYALGALEVFDSIYDVDTVQMTIFQPRLGNISVDEISKVELYDWAENILKPAAIEAEAGTGVFHTGQWCRFCKAKHICRERAKRNLELAAYDFTSPPLLSDEEISEILEKVDQLTTWAGDVKEYALQEAIAGKAWPGFKLVEGRSIRKYMDETKAAELVEKEGFNPYEQKLLSITEMQKMLGKKKFEELLGGIVEKPAGKPSLVREDDKRPAMSMAKNDFND